MAIIKTEKELIKIRAAGSILAYTLVKLSEYAKKGVSLLELDALAEKLIKERGGEPAFLNYKPEGAARGFPNTLCTSLNEIIVHGVPTKYRLKDGDLLSLDLGVRFQGYCADAAITIGIGKIPVIGERLISGVKIALKRALEVVKPGNTLGDIGFQIERTAKEHKFSIIQGLTGHGIGKKVHEDPMILNHGNPGKGMKLVAGMVLAIEPMFSTGSQYIEQIQDESYKTIDDSLSAHVEHTIIVTRNACEVVTAFE